MSYVGSASIGTLRARAAILARVRQFFESSGVLEVETPALATAGVSDLALESITARARSLGERTWYLQTSPEHAMKRLLAAGSGDIYQICRVFRDDELGRWHQPEFTLLEWYRIGWDERRLMDEVEELLRAVFGVADRASRTVSRSTNGAGGPNRGPALPLATRRLPYAEAFAEHVGVKPTAPAAAIEAALGHRGIDVPAGLEQAALVDLAFATLVTPRFGERTLTFVYDYPASHSALARLKPTTPPVAARFEAFLGRVELANGFHELADPAEQRRRFAAEIDARRRAGRDAPPLDESLLAALGRLPNCAGVAVGVDRLVALTLGFDSIAPAVAFMHEHEQG